MVARIYKPTQSTMQSGRAGTRHWVLEYEAAPLAPDPLMGWITTADTRQEVQLRFDSLDRAIAYADRNGIAYEVIAPHPRRWHPMRYADNYRSDRLTPFTH